MLVKKVSSLIVLLAILGFVSVQAKRAPAQVDHGSTNGESRNKRYVADAEADSTDIPRKSEEEEKEVRQIQQWTMKKAKEIFAKKGAFWMCSTANDTTLHSLFNILAVFSGAPMRMDTASSKVPSKLAFKLCFDLEYEGPKLSKTEDYYILNLTHGYCTEEIYAYCNGRKRIND